VGRRQIAVAAVLVVVLLGLHVRARSDASEPAATRPGVERAADYTFRPEVSPVNQQVWREAVAAVRPEAAALFEQVKGLVDIEDREPPEWALAVVTPEGNGRYLVTMPFGRIFNRLGQRGLYRAIHHELGHVVDAALLTGPQRTALDAGIPPGQPCAGDQPTGSCAPARERFAESFAKWATGDLGIDLYAGYKVPPPPDLEAWGRPLADLARAGAAGG